MVKKEKKENNTKGNKKKKPTQDLFLECSSSSNTNCQDVEKHPTVMPRTAQDSRRKHSNPVVFVQVKNRLIQRSNTDTFTPNSGAKNKKNKRIGLLRSSTSIHTLESRSAKLAKSKPQIIVTDTTETNFMPDSSKPCNSAKNTQTANEVQKSTLIDEGPGMLNLPSPRTVGCSLYFPLSENRKNVISQYAPEQTLDINGIAVACKDFSNLKTDVWDPSFIKQISKFSEIARGSEKVHPETKCDENVVIRKKDKRKRRMHHITVPTHGEETKEMKQGLNLPSPRMVGVSLFLPMSTERRNNIQQYSPDQTLNVSGINMTCRDFANFKNDTWLPSSQRYIALLEQKIEDESSTGETQKEMTNQVINVNSNRRETFSFPLVDQS